MADARDGITFDRMEANRRSVLDRLVAEGGTDASDIYERMEREHTVTYHGDYDSANRTSSINLCCACGWEGELDTSHVGIHLYELAAIAHAHLESQPGYVPYYSRPCSFDIDA